MTYKLVLQSVLNYQPIKLTNASPYIQPDTILTFCSLCICAICLKFKRKNGIKIRYSNTSTYYHHI